MISCGYGLGFSTYTEPGRIWFNFKEDVFVPQKCSEVDEEGILDGGSYNLGQCPRHELERVRKIALRLIPYDWEGYVEHGRAIPDEIHEAVQLFGNLEELILIDQDWYDDDVGDERGPGDVIVVDMGVEEIWDHHYGWQRTSERYGYR
jgi:hypothetical protein